MFTAVNKANEIKIKVPQCHMFVRFFVLVLFYFLFLLLVLSSAASMAREVKTILISKKRSFSLTRWIAS